MSEMMIIGDMRIREVALGNNIAELCLGDMH